MNKFNLIGFLSLFATTAVANPVITERITYYKIYGTTAEQLRAQMNELGPVDHDKRVDAKTSWFINWSYQWHYDNPSQNPCYVTSVKVTGDITYLLPEWANESEGNSPLKTQWAIYIKNLFTHEGGHAQNAKLAAIEIERALLSVQPQASCKALQNNLESTAKGFLAIHNAWDIKYDLDTDHGKKQGAVFP